MARSSLPTFNQRSAELTYVFWGGTTATGKLLGQVQDFNWTNALEERDTYRVGSSSAYTAYTANNVEWTLTLYEDSDIEEIGKVLGYTKPTTGGWTSGTTIQLSTTQSETTVTVASYDSESAASAVLLWQETLSGVKVSSVNPQRSANEINTWAFSGKATSVVLTPASGLGA